MGWTVQGSNPGESEILRTCLDRFWGPPSLLYNWRLVSLPGVKRPGRGVDAKESSCTFAAPLSHYGQVYGEIYILAYMYVCMYVCVCTTITQRSEACGCYCEIQKFKCTFCCMFSDVRKSFPLRAWGFCSSVFEGSLTGYAVPDISRQRNEDCLVTFRPLKMRARHYLETSEQCSGVISRDNRIMSFALCWRFPGFAYLFFL